MKKYLILLYFIVFLPSVSISQNLGWLRTPTISGNNDKITKTTIDDEGNIYVVGDFGNPFSGTSTETLTLAAGFSVSAVNTKSDIFVAKYSPGGEVLWVKSFGTTNEDYSADIVVEPSGSYVYVLGSFLGVLNLPNIPTPLTNSIGRDAVVYKMYKSTGEGIDVLQIGAGNGDVSPKKLALNGTNLVVAGNMANNTNMAAVVPTSPQFNGVNSGGNDVFIASFSTINFGYQNGQLFGGASSDIAWGVDVDGSGGVFVTGTFSGVADFGAGQTRTAIGTNGDAFVAKYIPSTPPATSYTLSWVRQFLSATGGRGTSVHFNDTQNKVYVTGFFAGDTDFDDTSSTTILVPLGSDDGFIATLNATGGSLERVTQLGTTGTDNLSAVTTDDNGNIYLSGYVGSGASSLLLGDNFYDSYDKSFTFSGNLVYAGFVGILNHSGQWAWGYAFQGSGSTFCNSINITSDKIIYGGQFNGTGANFNPYGTNTSNPIGQDLFLVSLDIEPFVVYNKNDVGFGSLRQSIANANISTGTNPTISFKLEGNAPYSIRPSLSNLPTITKTGLTIDGLTQTGATTSALTIGIDGSFGRSIGFDIAASNVTIRGLNVRNFSNIGINIRSNADDSKIENCWIGTDITGISANSNGTGISINSENVTIGGAITKRNVISGNLLSGVFVNGVSSVTIENNYIGLNTTGVDSLGNARQLGRQHGIHLNGVVGNNIARAVIKSNIITGHKDSNEAGIYLFNTAATPSNPHLIVGNKIGTDFNTNIKLNNDIGIMLEGVSRNIQIGATNLTNIIAGNRKGIWLKGSNVTNNIVKNNYIGTNLNNNTNIENETGIAITFGASNNQIGSSTLTTDQNIIAFNDIGIEIDSLGTINNKINRNSFFCNSGAILLTNNGNNNKTAPIITSATQTNISGTCQAGDRVDIYSINNSNCVSNTIGQGSVYLGTANLIGTNWSLTGNFSVGTRIVAIATDGSNSSPFSSSNIILAAPTNFVATTLSTSSIRLNWTGFVNNTSIDGFEIQRSTNINFSSPVSISANLIPSSSVSFDDTGLNNNTQYFYRIRTIATIVGVPNPLFSAWSNAVSATTGVVANAPTGLTAVATSFRSISLNWIDNANNELGFEIERASIFSNNFFERIAIVQANITTYIDNNNLDPLYGNTRYKYRVRAIGEIINSNYTNIAQATTPIQNGIPTPIAPTEVDAQAVSTQQIDVQWNYSVNPNIFFIIERKVGVSGAFAVLDSVLNLNTAGLRIYNDTSNIQANEIYCYRIRVSSPGGLSAYSQQDCAVAICGLNDLAVVRDDEPDNPNICSGKSAVLRLNKNPYKALYQWKRNGVDIIGANFSTLITNRTGQYSCVVNIAGSGCQGTTINQNLIVVLNNPIPVNISYNGTCLKSSERGDYVYQWFKNYQLISSGSGASNADLCTKEVGVYHLVLTANGCSSTSNTFIIGDATALEGDISNQLQTYPNPVEDLLNVKIELNAQGKYTWEIKDLNGKIVAKIEGEKNDFLLEEKLNMNGLAKGIYIIEWKMDKLQARKKIIKQ
jgi:hypothetical protein